VDKSMEQNEKLPATVETCRRIGDQEVVAGLHAAARQEGRTLAVFLAYLAEFDRRRLYAPRGCHSLFAYCTRALGYSEDAAAKRIQAARAALRLPAILQMIHAGEIHLSAVVMLAPRLTAENHLEMLERARGKSKLELQLMLAAPAADPTGNGHAPAERDRVEPVAADRVRFGFTGGIELLEKLQRVRELLWHKHPGGRLGDIVSELAGFFLERRDPALKVKTARRPVEIRAPGTDGSPGPNGRSRRIPQWVKDAVWHRDGGTCAFMSPEGMRCRAKAGLEFDHVIPWALGGRSDAPENIRLLCRTHNQMFSRQAFSWAAQKPSDPS